jgi:Domain of unknown function (DUF4436)
MLSKPTRRWILIVLCIFGLYFAVLLRGTTESTRRSLRIRDETAAKDRVVVSALVTSVNPVTQELIAQLGFRLSGNIAQDEVTPAADIKLLINNVGGQQEYDFPKGKRMNRIEVEFPLNGDLNRYPFDRYETTMRILMTTPVLNANSTLPKTPVVDQPQVAPDSEQLVIGAVVLQRNAAIPVSLTLSAAIPGIKFGGTVTRNDGTHVTGIALKVRRADNLIAVSILINGMMAFLAISVLAMALRVLTENGNYDLVPLSISISLIFGLPALRNVQPGVPPVGAFSDYVIFIWAELIVAVSAIITAWHWLLRGRKVSEL